MILWRRGRTVSGEGDRVAAADGSATEHRGVHADVHRIVLGGGPEDPRIFGQVVLRQRDHHAAGAGFGDGQPDVAADRHGVPDPVVLGETPLFRPGRYDDVGAETPGLETSLRVQRPQMIDGRGGLVAQPGRVSADSAVSITPAPREVTSWLLTPGKLTDTGRITLGQITSRGGDITAICACGGPLATVTQSGAVTGPAGLSAGAQPVTSVCLIWTR